MGEKVGKGQYVDEVGRGQSIGGRGGCGGQEVGRC